MSGWAAAAAVGSSALDYVANRNLANWSMKKQARIENDYFRSQRQTAYQDTMLDMRNAGLNPILAYSQGPTSASGVNISQQNPISPFSDAVSSFNNLANSAADRQLKGEQTEETRTRKFNNNAQHFILENQDKQMVVQLEIMREQQKQAIQNTANGALDLQVKQAFLEAAVHKGEVAAGTKEWQWLDRLTESLGKILGNTNSATDIFNKNKGD